MQLSEVVQQFIATHITSVDQIEIVLLLYKNPNREWTAEDAARDLFMEPQTTAARMAEMAADGLISSKQIDDRTVYRHGPRTMQLEKAISELPEEYPKYRVSIINLIFSKPIDNIRTFADAFRFRKDREENG